MAAHLHCHVHRGWPRFSSQTILLPPLKGGWRRLNAQECFGWPMLSVFESVGLLTLLFSSFTRTRRRRLIRPTTVQPSFSTIRCKTLNLSILSCYTYPVSAAMVPPRLPDFFRRRNSIPHAQFPNYHRITSFADPHLLNPFTPYRYKNHRGWGARPSPRRSDLSRTSHSPYTLPSSVSSKSFTCHSYENCRGVGAFFPFWNSRNHPPLRSSISLTPSFEKSALCALSVLCVKNTPLPTSLHRLSAIAPSPLSATLTRTPISVDSKALTEMLIP